MKALDSIENSGETYIHGIELLVDTPLLTEVYAVLSCETWQHSVENVVMLTRRDYLGA